MCCRLSAHVCFLCFLCVCEGASRWIVNPLRPGSVLNATVTIAPRKGTCGLNRACWAYASHTLPVWMARCMILQVSISCCLPGRLVSNKPLVHLRVCVYQRSLLILRQATESYGFFLLNILLSVMWPFMILSRFRVGRLPENWNFSWYTPGPVSHLLWFKEQQQCHTTQVHPSGWTFGYSI